MVDLLGGFNCVKNLIKFFRGVIDFFFFCYAVKNLKVQKDFKAFFLVVNEVH